MCCPWRKGGGSLTRSQVPLGNALGGQLYCPPRRRRGQAGVGGWASRGCPRGGRPARSRPPTSPPREVKLRPHGIPKCNLGTRGRDIARRGCGLCMGSRQKRGGDEECGEGFHGGIGLRGVAHQMGTILKTGSRTQPSLPVAPPVASRCSRSEIIPITHCDDVKVIALSA